MNETTTEETPAQRAYRAYAAADYAWSQELRRLYGNDAGTARYQKAGKGEEGTELRRLHDAFTSTGAAYRAAIAPEQGT